MSLKRMIVGVGWRKTWVDMSAASSDSGDIDDQQHIATTTTTNTLEEIKDSVQSLFQARTQRTQNRSMALTASDFRTVKRRVVF